jgi:RND family efflux transporter MFP subunit
MSTARSSARAASITLAVGLTFPLMTAACLVGDAEEEQLVEREAQTVRTATVEEAMIRRPVVAVGTFGPKERIALSFKVGGIVESVRVDAGESVRAGQVLASLHLREIDARLDKARSIATQAKRDFARARRLHADSVVPLSQLQDAETAFETAQADLETTESARQYAEIVAPSDGVILDREVEAGETVSPGRAIVTLGSRRRGAVLRVGLADRHMVRLQLGDRAVVRFDAVPGRVFAGAVSEIGAAAEPGIGTYPVEVALTETTALAAGMVGRAEIIPSTGLVATVLPIESVLEADGNRATVFVLDEDGTHARRRRVTVAFLDRDRVAVTEGLSSGSTVVTAGAAWLLDGDSVRVVR